MSNLITDILKSHLDFNENKTKIKSLNSGILENKVKKDFEFFNTKNGKFNFDKIVNELTNPKKKKNIKDIWHYIYFIFFFIFIIGKINNFS